MRHTRAVAVLLAATAVLVALQMPGAGSGPGAVALMLTLSGAPLAAPWAMARPSAREAGPGTVRAAVSAVLLLGLGFVIAQLVLVVGDLAHERGTLRSPGVAAAAVVTLAGAHLVLVAAAGTASVPVLRPIEVARWARDHGEVVAGLVVVLLIVLGAFLTAQVGAPRAAEYDSGLAGAEAPVGPATIAPQVLGSVISRAFPDPVLRDCITAALPASTASVQGLPGLIMLSCPGTGGQVHSLEGLQYLTNVETLDLSGNAVQDLTPLSGLLRLQKLDLSDNQITAVAPLAGAIALDRLTLTGNRITDPRPLQELPALTMLNIEDNRISDVSRLAGCPKVNELWIGRNPLTDVAPLVLMPSLLGVDLNGLDQPRVTGVQVLRHKGVYVGGQASGRE